MSFKNNTKDEVVSEINVTPLVDVMLVLLVIFMVTAPMMFNGISLQLPKTNQNKNISASKDLIILSVKENKEIFIGKNKIKRDEIVPILKKLISSSGNKAVFLRADKNLKYGHVARLMSLLKSEGIKKISLITELESY